MTRLAQIVAPIALLLPMAGCGGAIRVDTSETPVEERGPMTEAWESPLLREHPLVGRIWHVRDQRWVLEEELVGALVAARFRLLGEKHDNGDHHRLQHRLLGALLSAGQRPTIAFEMIDVESQEAIDGVVAAGGDADALAEAVEWEQRWGSWELYRPLLVIALAHGLPIVGANFPLSQTRALARGGLDSLGAETVAALGLDRPLEDAVLAAMRREMVEAHCGHLPEAMAGGMVLVQRARDGQMAERLASEAGDDGAVLIAGAGHTRNDRGVAHLLGLHRPNDRVVSVAFIEVDGDRSDPRDYSRADDAEVIPYDFLWFTPRDNDDDPCAAFRERRE